MVHCLPGDGKNCLASRLWVERRLELIAALEVGMGVTVASATRVPMTYRCAERSAEFVGHVSTAVLPTALGVPLLGRGAPIVMAAMVAVRKKVSFMVYDV